MICKQCKPSRDRYRKRIKRLEKEKFDLEETNCDLREDFDAHIKSIYMQAPESLKEEIEYWKKRSMEYLEKLNELTNDKESFECTSTNTES